MKTVSPWQMMVFWPNRDAGNRPMASYFLYRRREFITPLGGAAAAWPIRAWAQKPERMRRIGMLNGLTAEDSQSQTRNAAFLQRLGELGWQVGRNLQIEYRWAGGDTRRAATYAAEMVALA